MKNNKHKKLIDKYYKFLGLTEEINVYIVNSKKYKIKKGVGKSEITDYRATVCPTDGSGNAFELFIARGSIVEDINDTILHELLHIFLWKYTQLIDQFIHYTNFDDETTQKVLDLLYKEEHAVINKLIKVMEKK